MKIDIKGVVVANDDKLIYEWFGIDCICPRDVSNLLEQANGENIEIDINSAGGDVYAGSEIYTDLMTYGGGIPGKVTSNIVGIAGSAASLPAVAGNPARISPTAQIAIHNVMGAPFGDYRKLEHEADILKNYNVSIANAYRLKTGLDEKKLLELMDAGGSSNRGSWLNAQQAKELGFVDEIMFDEGNRLVANFGFSNTLPPEVVNKMRNHLKSKPKEPEETDPKDQFDADQASLELLKLKYKEDKDNE